jgi:serine phosphatase RsbU (regulator of sigma subunit)/predicted Rossmann-fold nucleotide-binding protein
LRTAAFWWKLDRDEMYARLPAPVVMLTPSSLSQWAHMQMARGRRSHVFLLSPQPPIPADVQLASPIDVERAVDLLREASSAAFRLAVYLSTSAFTIPVARLVQEAQFGAAAQQSDLAEVLLSGLVTAHSAPGADPNELYYYFLPKARAILMRSLRDADAQSIAAVLERRLSQYLQQIQGRSVTFHSLIPDESGKFELPEWAQPFAHVGLSLLGKSVHGRSTVASSPDKPRVPSLWILVAGTGSNELAPTVLAAAKRVGTWLADNRYGLITCGWQGVDRVVAESFANALSNADLSVDDYLVHVLKRDRIPAFTNGRRVHVDNIRQEFTQSVERADAVLLIGGLGGTRQVGKRALKVRVPVYPLASTGGDAKWILEHILQDWNKFSWLPISRSQFSVLRNEERALDVIAASLRQNVNADRSEESPRDDSKGCDPDPHPKWVLVAGSSRDGSKDDFSRFAIACQSLGTELARSGFAIVVGSFSSSTADHHVLRGALETAEARTLVIRPQSAPARSEASFFLDVPVESAPGDWKAVRPKQLDRADALLLIAGGQGTGDVFAAAQSSHRSLPILLVPAFGGFAARKYAEYRGEYLRSGVARDTLKRLEQWDDSTPAAVVSILRILLGLRATYLLTWNPAYGTFRQFESVALAVRESGAADISWSVGWPGQEPPMRIAPGDRVFFMRHGSQRPGLIGSGEVIGEKYEDVHWSENQAKMGNRALYAPVRFDALREFPFIPLDELIEQTKEESLWTKVGTGHLIEPRLAQCLEDLWKQAVAPPGEAVAPLPPPNDPDEFESLCLELWREIWQDPDAQKHARRGQPDDGVDIVGQYQGKRIGIQCKLDPKTQHASLAVDQLDSAVHKAERFQPPLSSFILATIAPRDEQLLQRAHQLTEEQRAKGGFEVEVWFWPDIWTELRNRTELLERIRGSDAKSGQQAWPHLERTMENAQLHEAAMRAEVLKRELAVAHEVQRGFLPSAAPSIPGYEFFEFYEPANQLGGDYYDYVELPGGRLAVVMADVSGKGISATLLMAKLSAETRYCLASEPSPVAAMGRLNRLFCDSSWEDRFVTMVLAVLDPRRHEAVVVNAGHLPPLWRRGPGKVEAIGQAEARLPLGVDRDMEYAPCTVSLAAGQSLVLYTDGITEAMNAKGELYGSGRLLALLNSDVDRLSLLGRRILDDVKRFVGARSQSDDMCLTCLGRAAAT